MFAGFCEVFGQLTLLVEGPLEADSFPTVLLLKLLPLHVDGIGARAVDCATRTDVAGDWLWKIDINQSETL